MNAPDVSLYSAKGAFWIVLHAYLLVSSIILLYCCLDSWKELRASIIVLAIVEWLYIPFTLSSIAHGIILLDILWYGLPRPNDWCANIKSRMLYHNDGGDITANTGKLTRIQNSNLKSRVLFTALFQFNVHYSNSWHYSKYSLLFKFGIWTVHEHSPGGGSGTQTLLQLFGALGKYGGWMVDAGCMRD